MRHLGSSRLALAITVALACACGGKGGGKDTTPPAPAGLPFDEAAVKAAMAATAVADADSCGIEGAATVADAMTSRREMMQASGGVDETFSCRASVVTDGRWECTWSVWEKTTGSDADDPCGGGTGFQSIAQVNADGSLVAGQLVCLAPG